MKFFTLAAFLALAVAVVSADVATIKSDISNIDSAVADLSRRLQSNNIGYLTALGIHNSAQDLDDTVQQATQNVESNTEQISESDAQDVITQLTSTEQNVNAATDRLIEIKSRFDSLGVTNLAKQDVAALQTSTKQYGAALVNASPESLQADAQALADKFNADLAEAATAYGV